MADAGHPDLLIADINLGPSLGVVIASAHRRSPPLPSIITGSHHANELIAAAGGGPSRVLQKPYQPEALLAAVAVLLNPQSTDE